MTNSLKIGLEVSTSDPFKILLKGLLLLMLLVQNSITAPTWLGDPLIASQLACLCTWYIVFYAQNIIYRVQLDSRKFSSGFKEKSTYSSQKASNLDDIFAWLTELKQKLLGTVNMFVNFFSLKIWFKNLKVVNLLPFFGQ